MAVSLDRCIMLTHLAVGPMPDETWIVAYMTPGCTVMTVACPCNTKESAVEEARRRNRIQQQREDALRLERMHCGMGGIYHTVKRLEAGAA